MDPTFEGFLHDPAFTAYYQSRIDKITHDIKKKIIKKHNKGSLESKKAKAYMDTDEFLDELEQSLLRSTVYQHLISEEGRIECSKFYNEHKTAIKSLFRQGKKLTDHNIKTVELEELAYNADLSIIDDVIEERFKTDSSRLSDYLSNKKIYFTFVSDYTEYAPIYESKELTVSNLSEFMDHLALNRFRTPFFKRVRCDAATLSAEMVEIIAKRLAPECNANDLHIVTNILRKRIKTRNYAMKYAEKMENLFTVEEILDHLKENPYYKTKYNKYVDTMHKILVLKDNILKAIPDDYVDLYPEARKMKRHFILHIGPTNSGKTYSAIQRLKEASSGAYLAPLRLLAYEQFDSLNKEGIYCNLLTGEESMDIPGATHVSSTIEMIDMSHHYDVVVIDEAQLIGDTQRGHAWTKAVLGALSEEIHVCAAEYAEDLLIRLIESCGDTYEVHHTERQTPLRLSSKKEFKFPKDVRAHDAIIVFSRRDVHAVASELQKHGIKCSLIYGSLPHNVRHNEAKKFNDGETDVVVSTDAIGMGLNMPIKRVVFLRTNKFDGISTRKLRPSEVQQIAGRAGRFGIYDEGLFAAASDVAYIGSCINRRIRSIDKAVISLAPSLIDIDLNLSSILTKWNSIPEKDGFIKADISEQIIRCQKLECITEDKHLIYDLIMIPFDEKDQDLYDLWFSLSKVVIQKEIFDFDKVVMPYSKHSSLMTLEKAYKIFDLYYYFYSKFWKDKAVLDKIMNIKAEISQYSMDILSSQVAEGRTCETCGKILPWNHRHKMCDECYLETKFSYDDFLF